MPLKAEEVRLTPYDATDAIPAGFKVAGEFKTRRAPSPMQYNWYSRWDGAQHEVFNKLAEALAKKPEGYTIEELKAPYDNEADKAKVDEIINKFKGSWDHRHTGFDLVMSEDGSRFMLIWRDPRVHYVKEIGLEGDFSQTPHQKIPSYIEKVPAEIEKARNPQPVAAPRAAAAPRAPRAPKAAAAEAATVAPTGGFMAAFTLVTATYPKVEGATIAEILNNAITQFVDPNALMPAPEETVKVVDRLNEVINSLGLESGGFVDFVAKRQKDTSIKAGFYKICKDLAKKYLDSKTTAETVAVAVETVQ